MEQGLIYAYLLDGAGGARNLSWTAAERWQPDQGVLWLHFDYTRPDVQAWLQAGSGLDPVVSAALLAEDTRPRAAGTRGGLLMALRGVNLNPGADPEDMVSIRVWADCTRVISTRHRRLLSVDDIIRSFEAGTGPKTSADFIVTLADCLTRRMSDAIDDVEDRVDELEDRVLTGNRRELRGEIAGLRRQAIALRRYMAPQREALARAQTEPLPWLGDGDRLRLREISDRMILYVEALDTVRERAAVAQEELVNQLSEESNRRMYVLSVVAAIFLPLSFFTGLLGINIGGMPGVDDPLAFWIFVALLLGLSVVEILYFRRRNWL